MISLPADLSQRIEAHVASGGYSSAEDVLYAALDALEVREDEDLMAIREGLEDVAQGRFKPLEVAEAEFRARNGLEGRS